MGNCQAIDNATLVIQHPCGRVDKLYWPVTAGEVMKLNPGHYVALLLTTTTTTTTAANNNNNIIRITRIKLLRPTDTLILGQAYRLITTQEVMKGLWAKKYGKMQKKPSEMESEAKQFERVKQKLGCEIEIPPTRSEKDNTKQVLKKDGQRQRTTASSNSAAAAKSKAWQPSLKSISEATS
ncbi:Chromodomain-helicase-DNA-binding protein like [Actinidia chinensis var. chinensis]|uniref:Chromodomain-helicase-DNA-binding protein like n=1 Tax=Actinidia chinensis var. chinensis TaxID=1590841 RepID=A0A2R6PUI7_ACTCC|nr:Chromodomain-helicase-DNA-binding protein like [Actinidia chinensis var. chinensis]